MTIKIHDYHGWLLFDKPQGITSTKAVNIIQKHWHHIKAGHGGTLDPFATGLLPIAFGEATKTSSYIMGHEKRYEFKILWGKETDTLDSDGILKNSSDVLPSPQNIASHLPMWQGHIMQTPPLFSAIKIKGKRAYDLARQGKKPELSPRPVTIKKLSLLSIPSPRHACFAMTCGKGVYVRALARDLAYALGTCATVIELRRTHIGNFSLSHTLSLAHILQIPYNSLREASGEAFWSLDRVLSFLPAVVLDEKSALRWRQGRSVALAQIPTFRSQVESTAQGRRSASQQVRSASQQVRSASQQVRSASQQVESVGQQVESVGQQVESVGQQVESIGQQVGGAAGPQGSSKAGDKESQKDTLFETSHTLSPEEDYAVWSRGQVIGLARCKDGHLRVQRVFNRPTKPLYPKGSL